MPAAPLPLTLYSKRRLIEAVRGVRSAVAMFNRHDDYELRMVILALTDAERWLDNSIAVRTIDDDIRIIQTKEGEK